MGFGESQEMEICNLTHFKHRTNLKEFEENTQSNGGTYQFKKVYVELVMLFIVWPFS